jgi:hypothetical protein
MKRDKKTGKLEPVERVRKMPNGRTVRRKVDAITGITLHATGCYYSPSKRLLAQGMSRAQAIEGRAVNVHAHMTCFATGNAILGYPRDWYVYHGHAFCPTDVGQEHEGDWGEDGVPTDAPAGYSLEAVIEAGRAGIASHLEALPNIRFIHLHRQTRGRKPACPGRIITREVGLWACTKYGLRFEPERTERDGTPIPASWLA